MATSVDDIRSLLEERLAAIAEERRRLEGALKALGSGPGATKGRRAGGVRRRSRPRRAAGRKARRGERADQRLGYVAENRDSRGSEIARALGMPPSQVYQLASRLEQQGRLEKSEVGYRLPS